MRKTFVTEKKALRLERSILKVSSTLLVNANLASTKLSCVGSLETHENEMFSSLGIVSCSCAHPDNGTADWERRRISRNTQMIEMYEAEDASHVARISGGYRSRRMPLAFRSQGT